MEPAPPRVAVTNTSPIISLAAADALFVLDQLFDRLIVPGDVWEELNGKPGAPEPRLVAALTNREFDPTHHTIPAAANGLGAGERAAIAVAVVTRPTRILLDERAARRVAMSLGLTVVGTVGLLVEARRIGLIEALKPRFDALAVRGFRVGPTIIARALAEVGEG